MKKLLIAGLLGTLLVPALAVAQSAFDGTWKVDLNKVHMPMKPDVMVLQNGMYQCKTCMPPVSVKADGADQPVSGHPYFDTLAVKAMDDHTIQETEKKDGKLVSTSTTTVAPDGKTATFEFTENRNAGSTPVTGKGTMTRVAKGPGGAHAISGSWRTSSYQNVSDNALTRTYKTDGDNLSMTAPTGESYTAKTDGTEAPYTGDPGTSTVAVKKMGKNVMQETDRLNGKVISVTKMSVAADGKTMNMSVNDKLHGTTMSFVATRE